MNLPKILLAEDDANFGMMLKIFLEMNGYAVLLCENGEIAWQSLQSQSFDAGIFDIMMPLLDGFTLGERLSQSPKKIPFVYLTAKALKDDQIKGYKIGASDYLIKPFDPEILLFKIKILLKNNNEAQIEQTVFQIGNYEFDYFKRTLTLANRQEKLSPKEAELLKLLCQKSGDVLSHTEALMKVWRNDDYFTKQSMNVFITKLRKYLSYDPEYCIEIENLHSKGFFLRCKKA